MILLLLNNFQFVFVLLAIPNYKKKNVLGFSSLENLDSVNRATYIMSSAEKLGLNMNKLIGLDFDGCSVISGMENGVQNEFVISI